LKRGEKHASEVVDQSKLKSKIVQVKFTRFLFYLFSFSLNIYKKARSEPRTDIVIQSSDSEVEEIASPTTSSKQATNQSLGKYNIKQLLYF
jgi:hypothetical protein